MAWHGNLDAVGFEFPLIADSALRAEDPDHYTECQVCRRPAVVYAVRGQIADAADRTGPDDDGEVYVACSVCIKGGRVDQLSTAAYFNTAVERATASAAAARAVKDSLQVTPLGIPLFMQGLDWPVCCDRASEFLGAPRSFVTLLAFAAEAREWHYGVLAPSVDFVSTGPPESLAEFSQFGCSGCSNRFFIWQPT